MAMLARFQSLERKKKCQYFDLKPAIPGLSRKLAAPGLLGTTAK